MSYFGRLVEQSHLTVASPSGGARSIAADIMPVADGLDASAMGMMNGDATDLVEINEIVEAPPMPVSALPRDVPARFPSRSMESDAVVLAPMSSVVDSPTGRAEREATIERVAAEVVSAPSEASSERAAPAAVEGSTYELAMRRVLEWVAAGPRSDAPRPNGADSVAMVEERIVERDAPARALDRSTDDAPTIVETVVAPARESPMRAITLAPRVEQAAREIMMDSRAAAAERATAANASPVVDDVVQVSIGSISVRIEAPASPTPTIVAPPPRNAAPPPQAQHGSERSTRLARRYLHP